MMQAGALDLDRLQRLVNEVLEHAHPELHLNTLLGQLDEERALHLAACLFESVSSLRPIENNWVYLTIWPIYELLGRHDAAMFCALQGRKLDPKSTAAAVFNGVIFRYFKRAGRARDAVQVFLASYEAAPAQPIASAGELRPLLEATGMAPRDDFRARTAARRDHPVVAASMRERWECPASFGAALPEGLRTHHPLQRRAIDVAELHDAQVLLFDGQLVVLSAEGIAQRDLCVAQFPEFLAELIGRLEARGAPVTQLELPEAVVIKDTTPDDNYGHFLIDQAPKLGLFVKLGVDISKVAVIGGELAARSQREIMAGLGVTRHISTRQRARIKVGRLWASTDTDPQLMGHFGEAWGLNFMRAAFGVPPLVPEKIPSTGRRRLYVSRNDGTKRRIVNEDEILPLLEAHGFEKIHPGQMPFAEQLEAFGDASHIIGPFGANLANFIFAPQGLTYLEIFHPLFAQTVFQYLAPAMDMNYAAFIAADGYSDAPEFNDRKVALPWRPDLPFRWHYRDIRVDPAELRRWLATYAPPDGRPAVPRPARPAEIAKPPPEQEQEMDVAAPETRLAKIGEALAALQAVFAAHPEVPLVAVMYRELLPGYNIPAACADAVRACLDQITPLLPGDHIGCLEVAHQVTDQGLLRIVIARAALRKVTNDTVWLHYEITSNLYQLIEFGVQAAVPPCLMHAMLVLQTAPLRDSPIAFMRKILARLMLPYAPREAILHASQALRGGQADAMPIFRAAAAALGLIKPDAPRQLPISVLREVEAACRLPLASSLQVVSTQFLGLQPAPVVPPSTVTLPAPRGDGFYHMFRDAGKALKLPGISVYTIEGGTISYDLTQLGRTQFYVFDHAGACIENLSHGAEPFIAPAVEEVAGELCVTADHFAGAMNVCHFLLDHLTRVGIYDHFRANGPQILFAETHAAYQAIIARAGLAGRAVYPGAKRFSIKADRLLVSSNIIADFRHPAHLAAPWAVQYVRELLRAVPAADARPERRLFISRQDARSRQILNWAEVAPVLEKFGFETVNLSELALDAQISTFMSAKYVAGVHGAGLTNAIFSPPGLAMLEILPPLVASRAYWVLCHGAGHEYYAMVADDPELPRPDYTVWGHHPEYNDRNVIVDPARLGVMLEEMTGTVETPV